MKNPFANMPENKAAVTVGVAFIVSVVIVTIVDDLLLSNFVVPGDTAALANDIAANPLVFGFAVVGYLMVLTLDAVIGLALYVVLKPADTRLALLTAALRLLYVSVLVIGVIALASQIIDVFGYTSFKLVGYVFFALHILVLGLSVLEAAYMPASLGVLLVLVSLTYAVFFVDHSLPEAVQVLIMFAMLIGELSLSIWLIVRRNKIPQVNAAR